MHHRIAVLHAGELADHVAGDVFVRHLRAVGRLARGVFGLHRLLGRSGMLALRRHETLVGLRGQRPVLGAVHAVVAAHHRADGGVANGLQLLIEAGDIFERRARRRIASVKERMHDDLPLRKLLARLAHELEEMLLMRMHAFVLKKPEEMKRGIVRLPVRDECGPFRALEKLAGRKAVIDALQLLNDDASRAHVEVPHLRRALVAVRKADGLAAAIQKAMRILGADAVDVRGFGGCGGVSVLAVVHAPAITDD